MGSAVVYDGVQTSQPTVDGLFAGLKFWFSSTVPQRSRFIDDVKSNGGEVVLLEKQADICLFDHARKNHPPGVYSYRFVEHSIRNGQLEDLEAHRIGGMDKRAARPVGSVTLASKGSRKPFTEADDQMLWDWVKPHEGMRGSAGNLLYQQLEEANPRHTFQSWRDRWLKYVQFQNRSLTSRNGQRQQDEAHVDEQPASTSTNPKRKPITPTGATISSSRAVRAPVAQQPTTPQTKPRTNHTTPTSASRFPRIAVEVPVNGSPQRKRGRPRKWQRTQSTQDTAKFAGPESGSQIRPDTGDKSGVEERGEQHATDLHHQTGQNGMKTKLDTKQELSRRQQRSPSFQTQSPTGWQSGNDSHRPGPKEARKRSPAKTDSQDSTKSQNLDGTAQRGDSGLRVSQVGHGTECVEEAHSRSKKRRKLSAGETSVLEIPSTPEDTQRNETIKESPSIATPRARKQPEHESSRSLSPLFVPSQSTDDEEQLPIAVDKENIDPETRTSPISVQLVSDHDPAITSSSSVIHENAERDSTGSPTPDFETAPDFSQIRQYTDQEEELDEFETAAEEPHEQKPSVADTQALFVVPTQNSEGLLNFGLPEPEGGWDALEAVSAEEENEAEASSPTSQASSTASTLDLNLDAWIALRSREGCNQDLLLEAAEATNMHKKLADVVHQSLKKGKGVPKDMKGVWTKEDDELLMGTDARAIKRMQEKHGQTSVNERFQCLDLWNAE